jgi:transposase
MSCSQIEILPNESEIIQLRKDLFSARYDANFYKSHYQNGIAIRERMRYEHDAAIRKLTQLHKEETDQLRNIIATLEAKVKLRERQLFGKKAEKGAGGNESSKKKSKRKRGQQCGEKSPPKRDYSHLPVIPEIQDIPESDRVCPCCNAFYADMGATEDSDIIEIEVQAHVRRLKRKKYRRTCNCKSQPVILTAPQTPKILSKSHLGNSVWVYFLMQKFWHGQPLHRAIQELNSHGLAIPAGTVIWGFLRLLPLFRCIYQMIMERSLTDKHWHADETGWKVFEALEGKANNRWFLWIFKSNSAAVFVLDPSRSAKVVEGFFGDESKGIISCDRYRAYFCFASKTGERFLIAYCWVHVRRDFLAIAKDWPIHEAWGMDWVQEIRHLYHLNNLRIAEKKGSQKFLECHKNLNEAVIHFRKKANKQRQEKTLSEPCRKALESLDRHWQGLTTFLEYPEVPMDNNAAERGLRGGAVGRKNYYGSGSVESAEFTAIMFTILQTLLIWGMNPQTWFDSFFNFIGSDWENPFDHWLPWNMSPERRAEFSLKKSHDPPDNHK